MTLVFRNVDVDPDDPVETWPPEAVATALERGDLSHLRRLTRAVERDPWGDVALAVEAAVEIDHPYGSGPLLMDVIARARGTSTDNARGAVARLVSEMISHSGLSLREIARRLGTSASRLSTYARGTVTPGADMLWRIAGVTGYRLGITNRPDSSPSVGQ